MSGLGNLVSGLSGLASGNQQFFNPVAQFFGGITGPQEDWTQYGYQENLLKDASEFAGSGTGLSTMATQAATGGRLGQAQQQGQISDVNAGAALKAITTGESASASTNQLNQQSLNDLASSVGNAVTNVANNARLAQGFSNPGAG